MASPGLNTPLRITISILVALVIGLLALLWNGSLMSNPLQLPMWVGNLIIIPLIATGLSYGACCGIQQLSCGHVQLITQAQRVAFVPLGFLFTGIILYFIPSLRWPIEGLFQGQSYEMRYGLSSAFYIFWTTLYTQAFLNGLAQICPR